MHLHFWDMHKCLLKSRSGEADSRPAGAHTSNAAAAQQEEMAEMEMLLPCKPAISPVSQDSGGKLILAIGCMR